MARDIPKPIGGRAVHGRLVVHTRSSMVTVRTDAVRLAILGIRRCVIRRIALAQLARVRVHGQGVGVVDSLGGAAAAEQRAEFGAVARRVVVGRRGAEALLLLAVAAKGELGKGGDDEEEAGTGC